MATTTKSTRKRPAKATTAKRSTKTATKKPTNKVASARTKPATTTKDVTVSKKAVKGQLSPLDRLRGAHLRFALLYLVFAGLVIGFVSSLAVPVTLDIQARDQFASKSNVVLGSAHEHLYNIQPKYIIALALVVSAVSSILLATKLRNRYETTLASRVSGLRWIVLGISAGLTIEFVGLNAGINDIMLLKLSAVLIFITTMLSWFAERDNIGARQPKWLAFVLSLVTGVAAWLPIFGSLIGTSLYGMERFSWYVYALVLVTLAGFTAFAINQYLQLRVKGTNSEYPVVEAHYLQIDMLTKFAVVLITLIALK